VLFRSVHNYLLGISFVWELVIVTQPPNDGNHVLEIDLVSSGFANGAIPLGYASLVSQQSWPVPHQSGSGFVNLVFPLGGTWSLPNSPLGVRVINTSLDPVYILSPQSNSTFSPQFWVIDLSA